MDEHRPGTGEPAKIHFGQTVEVRLPTSPVQLFPNQGDEVVDVADIAVLQQGIGKHGSEGGRNRHGQAPVDAIAFEALEHLEERNVGFSNGFVEPIFLEEVVILRMPHEGEMCVKNKCEITERHHFDLLVVGMGRCR